MKSSGIQNRTRHLQKFGSARGHANKRSRRSREVSDKGSWDGTNLQSNHVRARRQRLASCRLAVRQYYWNSAHWHSRAVLGRARLHDKSDGASDFSCKDPTQLLVGLDQQKVIGRLNFEPLPEPCTQHRKRDAELSCRAKEARDHLIERQGRCRRYLWLAGTNVNAAAAAELNPAIALELAISRADCVGVEMKAPGQIASAGQTLARLEVVAQDAKDDLRDQLFADGDFTAAGKPELHGGNIISVGCPARKMSRPSLAIIAAFPAGAV